MTTVLVNLLRELLAAAKDSGETCSPKLAHRAEDVLVKFFEIGKKRSSFTADEKRTVGPLIKAVLPALELKVDREIRRFPTTAFETVCACRSGLQYLLDDYRDFPTSAEKGSIILLAEDLEKFAESLDLEEYDDSFRNYQVNEFDPAIDVSAEITKVLKSHWWWWLTTLVDSDR